MEIHAVLVFVVAVLIYYESIRIDMTYYPLAQSLSEEHLLTVERSKKFVRDEHKYKLIGTGVPATNSSLL